MTTLKLKSIARRGCEVDEVAPRWDLRLKMDPKLAAEGGAQAMDKIIEDGRNGRIVGSGSFLFFCFFVFFLPFFCLFGIVSFLGFAFFWGLSPFSAPSSSRCLLR